MIRAVIFDFGNVLVHFDPAYITRQSAPTLSDADQALLTRVCFDRAYWDRLDRGDLDDADAADAICLTLPAHLHPAVREIFDHWYRHLPEWDGMAELAAEWKQTGGKLYLLSNISRHFAAHSDEIPVLKSFDGKLMSGTVGIVKPTADIFRTLLTRFDLRADECVFVDDAPRNIAGAVACGIDAILFTGDADALRAEFVRRKML